STFLLALLMLGPSCLTTPTASMAQDSPPRLVLLPADFELRGRDASQHLLVHRLTSDEIGSAVESADIEWSIDGPQIVNIVDSIAYPIADGTTRLVAACDGQQVSAVVSVSGCDDANAASAWGFRNDVLPVLSRLGCNSGACHGALAGKGGFRLSLRGYDPLTDHHTITRQARGRRIELADPGRSLLLTKPTGALPHKGGVRLEVDSLEYRILAEWIAQGAPGPATDDPT
ncbi:MAG: S-layer protein, partial [Planctomycetales bacterium]|nr:S-layer protein [Planctomycetales bacterium]